jgi:predicted GIY-YIG superfamily endonuclease
MHYVYILKSETNNSRYIGRSGDLKNRLSQHNSGCVKYTRSKRPWRLVWYCAFTDETKASLFEKYLKSSSGYAFMSKRIFNLKD